MPEPCNNQPLESYRYRIDADGVVVDVGGDWTAFCDDNAGGAGCLPARVIGTPLRQCIADWATWNLYELLIDSVRTRQRPVTVPIRCDSPGERRFCDLRIAPADGGHVDFESRLLRREARDAVHVLETGRPRADDRHLKVCSVCKRAEVATGRWVELEDAERELRLFDRERLPRVSHGLCPDCHARLVEAM